MTGEPWSGPAVLQHWRDVTLAWIVLMTAIGAIAALVVMRWPRWRERLPMLVPLVVGTYGAAFAAERFVRVEVPGSGLLLGLGAPRLGPLAAAALGLGLGLGGAWLSFRLEQLLLTVRPRRRGSVAGLPVAAGVSLPGRSESMAGVARVARSPGLFVAVSVVSATGEELFFRGAMLAPQWESGGAAPLWGIAAQAALFAALHLTFGWRSVLAKFLLGLCLAAGALVGGLVLGALVPHLLFQLRVLAQFHRPWARSPKEAVHV